MSDQHYFSNGTEGEMWMSNWCYRCVHDHGFHGDDERGAQPCMDQVSLYLGEANPVLIGTERTVTMASGRDLTMTEWSCINFRRCPCDRRDDPGVPLPIPPDPNQGELFDSSKLMPGVYRDVVLDAFTEVAHV